MINQNAQSVILTDDHSIKQPVVKYSNFTELAKAQNRHNEAWIKNLLTSVKHLDKKISGGVGWGEISDY